MAHALRYYKELTQPDGTVIRLEIHKKNIGDAITASVEIGKVVQALHLDIQGGADTIDAPIVKTSLTMTFVDAPDLEEGKKCGNWEEFYTPDSTMWMVVLKADGKTIWGGYVTPDSYQEDLRYRGSVTIIARDNIGHMQDFPFDMEGNADGMVTLQELVNEAWAKIESPMSLDWRHEGDDADYLLCDGVEAPQTYLNVSAFEDMNYFDAVEKALYSYGLVMRYTGSNRVAIMSLRDVPYQGKSSAPRAVEPIFLAHAQRELAPAARRIEESVKYDIGSFVCKPVVEDDYTWATEKFLVQGNSVDYNGIAWPIINKTSGIGWANPDYSLFFNPYAYEFAYGRDEDKKYMWLAGNSLELSTVGLRYAEYSKTIVAERMSFIAKFGNPYFLGTDGKLYQSGDSIKSVTLVVKVVQDGTESYLQSNGEWAIDQAKFTVEISGDELNVPISFDEYEGSILLCVQIHQILTSDDPRGFARYIPLYSASLAQNYPLLETNDVNTKYIETNNVILTRDPELGPAYNVVSFPSAIKNGIFVKSGSAYLPAKGWAWSGGTPQQMAVYNHLQLLCYHSKPNNIISGDIVNADFVDMEAIYEWGGANHLLVSGSYNFLNGRIESAVLREFKFYAEMWSDVAGAEVPETEQNNRTTAESGSGASKASTYSNETTVNIGGTGGGGTGGSSTLAGLLDVQVSSPSNGQALVYDSVSGMWMNKTIEKGNDITSQSIISALGYTPFDSAAFTKANIKNALGIKDWALASSKPSYTFAEITSKPTTLSGYGITDAILYQGAIDLSSAYRSMGYGHASKGWRTSGPAVVFGDTSYNLAMQCAIANADYVSLYVRNKYNGVEYGWDRIVTEGLLSRGAISFDTSAYKCLGDIVIHRNSESGDTYLNYGVANTDKADLRVFGYNISFYAGEASAYNTYLSLYAGGTAQFFVPLTIAANLTVTGNITASGNSSSKNYPTGKVLSQDPTSAFISTIFDADAVSDSSYRMKILRSGNIAIDGVCAQYSSLLALKSSDTHGFISIGYTNAIKNRCYIGAGTADTLSWSGILFHNNMDLIPKDDGAFYLGYSDKRWRTLNAVNVSADGIYGYVPEGGTYQRYRLVSSGDTMCLQVGAQDGTATTGKLTISGINVATLISLTIYSQQTLFSGAVQVNGTSRFVSLATFDNGLKIGDATLTWDASAGMLKIDKGVYSDGAITAKKKA